jgi:ABC-2 type transport system ATP-binding protein
VIASLRDLGKTIFLTTHYMEEAQQLADRVAIIAGGRIVAEGPPGELSHRDHRAALIRFLLPAGMAAGDLPGGLVPEPNGARAVDREVRIRAVDPVRTLNELTAWAIARSIPLAELEVRQPNLEDVYLELTEETSEEVTQ